MHQAPVVQRVDNSIYRINRYPTVDSDQLRPDLFVSILVPRATVPLDQRSRNEHQACAARNENSSNLDPRASPPWLTTSSGTEEPRALGSRLRLEVQLYENEIGLYHCTAFSQALHGQLILVTYIFARTM